MKKIRKFVIIVELVLIILMLINCIFYYSVLIAICTGIVVVASCISIVALIIDIRKDKMKA